MYAPATGTYTVLVYDNTRNSGNDIGVGQYNLHYAKVPDAIEHGVLSGVGTVSETVSLGDIDTYRIFGSLGSQLSLQISDINLDTVTLQALLFSQSSNLIVNRTDSNQINVANFVLPEDGIYTLLIVDNSRNTGNNTGIGDYTIAFDVPTAPLPPEAPVAIITAPDVAFRDQNISLDASMSFDPDGSPFPISYQWRVVSVPIGSQVSNASLTSLDTVSTGFVADVLGNYDIELVVDDGAQQTATISTIAVVNQPPVADAGISQEVENGSIVTLDGSSSADADGDMLEYAWVVVNQPDGASVSLSDPASVMPSFTPTVDGTYTFGLVVDDGFEASNIDLVEIIVTSENTAPVAIIEVSGSLFVGSQITLDASQSTDADNGPLPLSYTWQSTGTLQANLDETDQVTTRFIPQQAGVYSIMLSVSDSDIVSMVTADITVTEPVVVNQAPEAIAGDDQTLILGQIAELDGSLSNDPDNGPQALSFAWSLVSVPTDSGLGNSDIISANTAFASIAPDTDGTFVLQLETFDGQDSDSDSVAISVIENIAPIPDVIFDNEITLGDTSMLDGSGSVDPDNGPAPISYSWFFRDVPVNSQLDDGDIVNNTSSMSSFTPDVTGTYFMEFVVEDGATRVALDFEITVVPAPVVRCDVDNSGSIDFNDIFAISRMLGNSAFGPDDPADWNEDGTISVRDLRGCMTTCTLPRCAIVSN